MKAGIVNSLRNLGGIVTILSISALMLSPQILYAIHLARGGSRDNEREERLKAYTSELQDLLARLRYSTEIPEQLRRTLRQRVKVLVFQRDEYICQYCGRHTEHP